MRADSIRIANLTLHTRNAFPAGPRSAPIGQFQIEGLIRRALQNPDSLFWVGTRQEGNRTLDLVRFADRGLPFAFRFVFDRSTGLPFAMETDNDDPVMGDVLTRVTFGDWRKVGAFRLPWSQEQRLNGVRYQRLTATSLAVDTEIPDSLFASPGGLDAGDQPPPQLAATPMWSLRITSW